ncbi:SRPBCC domain-containing protein [Dietzia sp.]|uniref:SRPBCC domain-containing protein n=1 Tax=Dietzia sp. TaxID=1871616 RepID=UPI002FDA5AFA
MSEETQNLQGQPDQRNQQAELGFTISGYISKPVSETYEAVADPERLSKYFTTGGAHGRLEGGTTVTWDFADFPGAFPVKVLEAIENERIVIEWASGEGVTADGATRVTFEFEPIDDNTRTLVSITEAAWKPGDEGAKAAFGNCYGWTTMLAGMKAWIEYGVVLREGFHK